MDTGFLLVVAMVATLIGGLASDVGGEYFANVAVTEDPGLSAKDQPAYNEAAADLSPILPVLLAAPSAKTATPAPAAAKQQAAATAPAPVPVNATAATADNTDGAQPSPELLGLAGDTPSRRPDGSIFMPMAMQRLMNLRTQITKVESAAPSLAIPGRITTSRDVGALVQARQGGVVEPVDGRLPAVGTRVTKGQLLVTVRPVLDVVRRAELSAKVAELENLIQMGSQRILRLQEVNFIRYRESKINAVDAELDGYRKQLQIYRGLLDDVTEIRAQSDGVISRVAFVAGQTVEPQATLFEIVDPARLWVEATAFNMSSTDGLQEAHAVTTEGQVLELRFIGAGLALNSQAMPLHFEIVGSPPGIQIGRSVTVIISQPGSSAKGVRLPVTALVHSGTGETTVWERVQAETFMSRAVTAVPLDGNNVLITSGIGADMRVVTAAPAILAQVR